MAVNETSGFPSLEPSIRTVWGEATEGAPRTLMVELRFPDRRRGRTYHLHLVLDVSASMREGDRFDLAMQAVHRVAAAMREGDRLSLTIFAHEPSEIVHGATARWCRANREEIERRVKASPALFAGKTHLTEVLQRALTMRSVERQWMTRIVVLTDGEVMDSGRCSEKLSRAAVPVAEVRALGFGAGFRPSRIREAVPGAMLGPVQAVRSALSLPNQVRHMASLGEQVMGRDARIEFPANVALERAFCESPSRRVLELGANGWFVDYRPLLESGRVYRYLLDAWPQAASLSDLEIAVSFQEESSGELVTFRWPIGESAHEPGQADVWSDVRRYRILVGPLEGRTKEEMIAGAKALMELLRLPGFKNLELERDLEELINRLQSEGVTEELVEIYGQLVVDQPTTATGFHH